jgi:hypothetical protein
MADSQVAGRFFNSGKKAAEDANAFIEAVGGREEALAHLRDFAAFDLRRFATNPDGTLNLAKYNRWMRAHDEALSVFPELRPRFENAARAQEVVDGLRAQREAIDAAYPIKPGGTDADVAAQFFRPGERGAEDVQRFIQATGGSPEGLSNLKDYAAHSLRQAAERPDGTLDLAKYASWMRRHDSALSAFPDLRAKFSTAADAQRAVEEAIEAQAHAVKALQKGVASHFLGADPVKAVQSALNSANPEQAFAELVRMTNSDPAAKAGLRRAVVDFISSRLVSNTEAANTGTNLIKSDQFQTFVLRHQQALRQVFDADQMKVINSVARDLQRSNRSIAGSKLPGGSNTAQDAAAVARHGGAQSLISQLGTAAAGVLVGHMAGVGAESGLVGVFGAKVVAQMRKAGIDSVNDLITEAMLNPELARSLLAKVPGKPPQSVLNRIGRELRIISSAQPPAQPMAKGGTVSAAGQPSPRPELAAPGLPAAGTPLRAERDLAAWMEGKRPPTEKESAPAQVISPVPEQAPPGRGNAAPVPPQNGTAGEGSLFDVGERTPRLAAKSPAIRAAIHAEIQRLVPGATANILDRHTFTYGGQTIELGGSYLDGIINVSLASPDPIRTATHEALHMMRDIGVIKPAEWDVLARVSRERWMPEYEIEKYYGPHYRAALGDAGAMDRMIEEGVAHAFADFSPNDLRARAKANLPPVVFTVYKRIANFFARVRAALQGHGFHSLDDAFKVRDTFEDMQSGETGKRPWQNDPYAEASAIAAEERARGEPLAEIKRGGRPPNQANATPQE